MANTGEAIRVTVAPSQGVVIVGALLIAFLVFITVRGDLKQWLSLMSL